MTSPVTEALVEVFRREIFCLHFLVYTNVYIYWFHAALKQVQEEKSDQRLILESRFL